jgi:hypothetical protein
VSREPEAETKEQDDAPLVVRSTAGANCSSVGSVVDLLFATAAVSTAVFAAAWTALAEEAREKRTDDRGDRSGEADDDAAPG